MALGNTKGVMAYIYIYMLGSRPIQYVGMWLKTLLPKVELHFLSKLQYQILQHVTY